MMHADRTNRVVLLLLAIVLLAAGVAGLLLSYGLFGAAAAKRSLLDNPVSDYVGRSSAWIWPAAAVVGLILIVLGVRWLAALSFSTDRVSDLTAPGPREEGRTTLSTSAVTRAVVEEVEGYPGVRSASARLVGDQEAPTLVLEATLESSAELTRIRDRIEDEAVAHVRHATDQPRMPVTVDLSVTDRRDSRVG